MPLAFLAGLWLLLGAVWLATYPLLAVRSRDGGDSRRRDLEAEKDRLVQEIHELELDRVTGKLSEEDYRDLEARLKLRAVETLEKIDALGPAVASNRGSERDAEPQAEGRIGVLDRRGGHGDPPEQP